MRIKLNPNRYIYGGTAARIIIPIVIGVLAVATGQWWAAAYGMGWTLSSTGVSVAFSIGVIAGGFLANAIFPNNLSGFSSGIERANEAQLPYSQEGIPIPYMAGNLKMNTIYLWSKNFRSEEIRSGTVSGGGKGKGGDQASQVIGYNYFLTFATGICLGPTDCLKAIYANEKKIWGAYTSTANIVSGSLVVGATYKNKGGASIVHDSVTYVQDDTFVAANANYTVVDPVANVSIIALLVASGGIVNGSLYWVYGGTITYMSVNYGDGQAGGNLLTGGALGYWFVLTSPVLVIGNTLSGSLEVGVRYKVFGYDSVTHDGNTYLTNTVFTASITTYSTVGAGIVARHYATLIVGTFGVVQYPSVWYRGLEFTDKQAFARYLSFSYTIPNTSSNTALVVGEESVCYSGDESDDITVADKSVRVYWGSPNQTPPNTSDSFLSAEELPDPNLSYPGICYLIFKDFALGNYTSVPRITVEISRNAGIVRNLAQHATDNPGDPAYVFPDGDFTSGIDDTTDDVNGAIALYEIMVSPNMGCSFPPSLINEDDVIAAAQVCEDEGLRISPYVSSSNSTRQSVLLFNKYLECAVFWDGAQVRIQMFRSDYLTNADGSIAAGKTYTVYEYTSVKYNGTTYLKNSSFIGLTGVVSVTNVVGSGKIIPVLAIEYTQVIDSLRLARQTDFQLPTEIAFSYTNRSNQHKTTIQTKRINSVFDETLQTNSLGEDFTWVCDANVASLVFSRYLRRKGLILAGGQLSTTREAYALNPGGVVLITNIDHPTIGSAESLFMRVAKIQDTLGDERISLDLLEDIYGPFAASLGTPVVSSALPANPELLQNSSYFIALEAPFTTDFPDEIVLSIFASRNQTIQSGYMGHASISGDPFVSYGRSGSFVLTGFIVQGYGITPGYDDTETLLIDFSGNYSGDLSVLAGFSTRNIEDGLDTRYWLLVNNELMKLVTSSLVVGGFYKFTVIRGQRDTVVTAHDDGATCYLLYNLDGVLVRDEQKLVTGALVQYKAQSIGVGGAVFDLTSITAKSLTLEGKAIKPLTPHGFQGNGSLFAPAYGATDDMVFKWIPRAKGKGSNWNSDINKELAGLTYSGGYAVFPDKLAPFLYEEAKFEVDILALGSTTVVRTIKPEVSVDVWGYGSTSYSNSNITTDGFVASEFVARLYAVGALPENLGLRSLRYAELICRRV